MSFYKVHKRLWRNKKFLGLPTMEARMLFHALLAGREASAYHVKFADHFRHLINAGILAPGSGPLHWSWVDLMECRPAPFGVMTGRPRKWISNALRSLVFIRDGFKCRYCGSPERLQLDHVVPFIRGGLDVHDNLVTACKPCNTSKGPRTVDEWRRRI